ncbi:MAG TPA: hypothetical protein IGS53_28590 [Leptolyngbyaceae cyanobacterium M33_DOE_097]|nr:hypothetical protein [Leptolyngbyaceae cyanobacterium M33_DOE_097]
MKSTTAIARFSFQSSCRFAGAIVYYGSAILDMRMILIKTSGFNVYEWLKPAFCRL